MPIDPIAPAVAPRFGAHLLRWTALGVFVAGLALRQCALVAASALVALQAFHLHMDANAPWQGWRAAIRCALAGLGGLLAAGGLFAVVAGVWIDWWQPHEQPLLALLALAVVALPCWISQPRDEDSFWGIANALAMLAAGVALLLAAGGWPIALCLFTAFAALAVGRIGWRLLHSSATELATADGRF